MAMKKIFSWRNECDFHYSLGPLSYILIFITILLLNFSIVQPGIPAAGIGNLNTSPGVWQQTAPLNEARASHTATLLPDGRLLVVGGVSVDFDQNGDPILPVTVTSSAEIYSPSLNTWSTVASMTTPRYSHTATLLLDGRVLVAGGHNGNQVLDSVEIFDPRTETWDSVNNLANKRLDHTATMLLDGKVLICGGTSGGTSIMSCEMYDPVTGTWTMTGDMVYRRSRHTATMLSDGRVLVASGWSTFLTGGDQVITTAEIFNPTNGTWTLTTGELAYGRQDHTATLMMDGRVLVAGGDNGGGSLKHTEIFDPSTGDWISVPDLNHSFSNHTATLLPDGRVLVVSGVSSSGKFSPELSVEAYDVNTGTWSNLSGLTSTTTRWYHTATLLPDGRVLAVGGHNDKQPAGAPMKSVEIFDPSQPAWTVSGSLNVKRQDHTSLVLPDGAVLTVGGKNGSGFINSVEKSDPSGQTWSEVKPITTPRARHTATLLQNGNLLVAGGEGDGGALVSTEIYNPSLNTWLVVGNLLIGRYDHTAVMLSDGNVLALGGRNGSGSIKAVELFTPSTGTWTDSPADMSTDRNRHTTTILPDQRILVVGGDDTGALSSAEMFDPLANTWDSAGTLSDARYSHTATLLVDGRILVAGGYNGSALASAEIFDPNIGIWTSVNPMLTARYDHTATLLPDGRVLLSGGTGGSGPLSSAEVYDPALDVWTGTDDLNSPRASHTAVYLKNGQVLAIGGEGELGSLPGVEVYDRGLGYENSWRPTISSSEPEIWFEKPFTLSGTGYRSHQFAEASSGGTNSSATNFPLVQLRRLDNEQTLWLQSGGDFTSTSVKLQLASTMFPGYVHLTIFVNAIPSQSVIVKIIDSEKVYLPVLRK
jgi:N-acetylneuraminic acid mutarotase